jgi:sortase A
VYIFGHSSDFAWTPGSYKTVFAKLPEIQLGTEIRISDDAGKIYTYKVIETKVVGPKDTSVLTQDPAKKLLTLQTSYPVGTALKRFLAVSELVE